MTTQADAPGRLVALPSGERVPRLGLGTWMMGERRSERRREVAALRLGLDLGLTLIDTAEMYADGGAEEMVAEAITGRRDEVFVVSKVYPHNASRKGTLLACERSLRRLRIDVIDLYLLHWRGSIPLEETVSAMGRLVETGRIRHWGVSNFDRADMEEVAGIAGGGACATDQVLYNLGRRGVEWDLLPWCRAHGMPVMAYSPIEQGRLARDRRLAKLAATLGLAPATLALAWVLRQPAVIAIPKASDADHVRALAAARECTLEESTLQALEEAFPPPGGATPLAML